MKKNVTALLLSAAMLCTMGLPAMAAEGETGAEQPTASPVQEEGLTTGTDTQEEQPLPDSILYYGRVTQVVRDENGAVTRLELTSESKGEYVMNVSEDTVWIDSGNRTASDPATLEEGEGVYVYHSPVATLSLPPQSEAYAVVRNMPQDARCASYHVAQEVQQREDGSWSILTDQGGLYIYVGENTGVSAYDGAQASLADLNPGDRFMAWYDEVLESYPAQTYASHIMLLPQVEEKPQEGARITMELDGKVPNMVGRYESGTAMVPVAAVAQALGFQVTYTPDTDQGTLVTVESDTFAVRMYLDLGLIYGATKIEGAVGMTGPQSYGMAPYIVAPGTTWAPADIFKMLGKTVTLEGTNLIIE